LQETYTHLCTPLKRGVNERGFWPHECGVPYDFPIPRARTDLTVIMSLRLGVDYMRFGGMNLDEQKLTAIFVTAPEADYACRFEELLEIFWEGAKKGKQTSCIR
jgi:hypothetical protein